MRYSHRFFLYAPTGLFFLLLAIVAGSWWVEAHAWAKRIDAANGHAIAPGVTMHFASRTIKGFPFRLDTVFQDFRISVDTPDGPAVWRAQGFAMHELTYGEGLVFEAGGAQNFSWTDRAHISHRLTIIPGSIRASAVFEKNALSRFDFVAVALDSDHIRAGGFELHLRRNPVQNALDIVAHADEIEIANVAATKSSDMNVQFRGSLVPGSPLQSFLRGDSDWRKAAAAWQAKDGLLKIADFEGGNGKVHFTGSGQIALDSSHRPRGLLNLSIHDPSHLLETANEKPGREEGSNPILRAIGSLETLQSETKARLVMKDGLLYVEQTPAGMLAPLY
jgi:hypothetical protein